MNVAIIPARGGSKRIPRKNIRLFFGKPMMVWSIQAALRSQLFDRILVSTDDDDIACIAQENGAEVPFVRPRNLADDYTGTRDVIVHAVNWLMERSASIENVCCIYATAPFVSTVDLADGLRLMESTNCSYVFSATEYAAPVFRCFRQNEFGGLEMMFPEHFSTRSQDLPEMLHDAGQFYWGKKDTWLNDTEFFSERSRVVRVPRWRVQDIDSEDDWARAELIAPQIFKSNGI